MKTTLVMLVSALALIATTQAWAADDDGDYSEYKVRTDCTYSVPTAAYTVHVRTLDKSGDWKARMDLTVVDTRGREKILATKFAEYTQHTGGESFRSEGMRLEIYYVDVSTRYPGGEKGIFDATLANGETLHFDGMSCRHLDSE